MPQIAIGAAKTAICAILPLNCTAETSAVAAELTF